MNRLAVWIIRPALLGVFLLFGSVAAAQPPSGIGYVDLQKILAKSTAGVAAREELEREKAQMQKDVDGKRAEIEKLKDELDRKGPLLSPEARKEKQGTLERKLRDLRRLVDDYQRELEKKEQGLLQKVFQDLSGVIERVGKQRGYLMVVDRKLLMYAAPEADLTDEIIKAYDQDTGRAKK